MPTDFHHGVRVTEVTDGARTISAISTAIIGLVCVAEDADVPTFPLDTPVLLTSVQAAIGKAGAGGADNTLLDALNAINAQSAPLVVVVRVGKGIDAAATSSNVIGTTDENGRLTGMQALLAAQARLGVVPRILGAPGLDTKEVGLALAVVAQKLKGMAYLHCDNCASVTEAVAYKAAFSQREAYLVWPNFTAFDTTTSATREVPAAAYALGLRAQIDEAQGWQKTLSNVAVNGVNGISIDVSFNLQLTATDADVLNEAGINTMVNSQGFRFWGNRTCSDDPDFVFESATRTAQVLSDTIANGVAWANDKSMYPSLVKDILEGINAEFRSLIAGGYILGGSAWYDATANDQSTLAGGKLTIDYDYSPVPPLENLMLRQHITTSYLADFATAINA